MTRSADRRLPNRSTGSGSNPDGFFADALQRLVTQPEKEIIMQHVSRFMQKFNRDEEAVTAIEYGLIAALIAVFIIASVTIVGSKLAAVFTAISTALAGAL